VFISKRLSLFLSTSDENKVNKMKKRAEERKKNRESIKCCTRTQEKKVGKIATEKIIMTNRSIYRTTLFFLA
jgi:recombinational DNA repair protein RecR